MRRERKQWRASEIRFLIENFDMTTEELSKHLQGRSKKSINRKLEKLRTDGRIGHRSSETINRAYQQRGKEIKVSKPSSKPSQEVYEEVENDYFFGEDADA